MTGLLRYAFLKNARDGTLLTLLLAPMVMLVVPTVIILLNDRSSKLRIPPEASNMLTIMMGVLMAGLAGFLLYRTEIANHSIGSLMLATRPSTLALSSAIYGCAVGLGAAITTVAGMFATGAPLPAKPLEWLVRAFVLTLMAASVATTAVTLTRSAAAIGWMYAAMVFFIGSFAEAELDVAWLAVLALTLSAVSLAVSTVLLERRCAS